MKDFFISHASKNRKIAEWIAWILEEEGYTTIIQNWDFRGNFIDDMNNGLINSKRTLAVISPEYFESNYCRFEWQSAYARELKGEKGYLVPVRIHPLTPLGLLGPKSFIDLVGKSEFDSRKELLQGIKLERTKPKLKPSFQQTSVKSMPAETKKHQSSMSVAKEIEFYIRENDLNSQAYHGILESPFYEGPGGVTALPVAHFMGRDKELQELRNALAPGMEPKCVIVTGQGGVGKTSLVQQFVATEGQARFIHGVVWIDSSEMELGMVNAARRFGYVSDKIPTIVEAKQYLCRMLRNLHVLLVFDNVWPTARENDLQHITIPGGLARTVITTRFLPLLESLGAPTIGIEMYSWNTDTAISYLKQINRKRKIGEDEYITKLLEISGNLPLTVRLVAKRLNHKGVTSKWLLDRLQRTPVETLDSEAIGADRGIAATFGESLESLKEHLQRTLLAMSACYHYTKTSTVAFVANMSEDEVVEALGVLSNFSLVNYIDTSDRPWNIHDSIRMLALEKDGAVDAVNRHINFVKEHVSTTKNQVDWEKFECELPEIYKALDHMLGARQINAAWELLVGIKDHLINRGSYNELYWYARRIEDLGYINGESQSLIGMCCRKLGKIIEAFEKHNNALTFFEKAEEMEAKAAELTNLGLCYYSIDQEEKAKEYFLKSLIIYEEKGKKQHQSMLLGYIAICDLTTSNVPNAHNLLQKAIKIDDELGLYKMKAMHMGYLGHCFSHPSEVHEALASYEKALNIDRQIGHLEGQANHLRAIATCYRMMGNIEQAKKYLEYGLVIEERIGRAEGIIFNLIELGNVYKLTRDYEKVIDSYSKALNKATRADLRSLEARILGYLGKTLFENDHIELGIQHLEQAHVIYTKLGLHDNAKDIMELHQKLLMKWRAKTDEGEDCENHQSYVQEAHQVSDDSKDFRMVQSDEVANVVPGEIVTWIGQQSGIDYDVIHKLLNFIHNSNIQSIQEWRKNLLEELINNHAQRAERETRIFDATSFRFDFIAPEDVSNNRQLKDYYRQRLGADFNDLDFILIEKEAYLRLIEGDHALLAKMIMEDERAASEIFIAYAGDKLNRVLMTFSVESPTTGKRAIEFIKTHKTTQEHEEWLNEMEVLAKKIQLLYIQRKKMHPHYYEIGHSRFFKPTL